jgi:endonuclease YncB( thermonuclease family)
VRGIPNVIDGGSLELDGTQYRLYGIVAPDPRQNCELRGREYDCGHVSKTALMDLVAGVPIRCETRPPAPGGTIFATCFAQGYDLSEGMVHTGWAMAARRDGGLYLRIERQAQKARRGLWKGKFVPPWDWKPD